MFHGQLKFGVQEFSGLGFVILNIYIYTHDPILHHSTSDLIDHLAFIIA